MRMLYGYAVKHPDEQCAVNPDTPTRTLCGREVGFLPAHDSDYTPTNLHQRCRELLYGNSPKPRRPMWAVDRAWRRNGGVGGPL